MAKNELVRQDELLISNNLDIESMIYEIRGQKVMLDSDLAILYGYEVKRLNEMVRNNINRFPNDFMFQLSRDELNDLKLKLSTLNKAQENDDSLRSKFSTLNKGSGRGSNIKYMPYVFTEQGIYALSGVLKGPLATAVSINLIRAFKQLKDFYNTNSYLLDKVIDIETKQVDFNNKLIKHDKKLNEIINSMSINKETKEVIFFNGQIYDAFSFLIDLISKANKEIILIDNYVDIKTLNILAKKKTNIKTIIYTSKSGNSLTNIDIDNFNKEYPLLKVNIVKDCHDRFLIIDNKDFYHVGASLKDAGKKSFYIGKINDKNVMKAIKSLIKN